MTTETTCHCGTPFKGSDHCPECFCEQFEAHCDHQANVKTCAECGERFVGDEDERFCSWYCADVNAEREAEAEANGTYVD